jgi:hypothetical protein
MRSFVRAGVVWSLLFGAAAVLPGQSRLTWAGPPLFILDVQGTPLDEFPNGIKALNGVMTTVDKIGQRMLMATSPSEFLITLPQALPAAFTVIVDLVPKACCAPDDFMLEGMPARNRGAASVELTWHPDRISAVGGGGDMYQSDMPADLAAVMPGNLTRLVFEFKGTEIKLYTNGRRLYTLDKQFTRGRVLRVWLGGGSATNPMYLAGLSVLSGAVASGVISANTGGERQQQSLPDGSKSYVPPGGSTGGQTESQKQAIIGPTPATARMGPTVTQGSAGPIVQWSTLTGVSGYVVKRWLSSDLTCCNNTSSSLTGPPWQDKALLVSGTYFYEVTASLPAGVPVSEQAQFTVMMPVSTSTPSVPMPTSASPPPPPPPSSTTATSVASATVAAQTGTPVRTAASPPPGSPAAAALAPTGPAPTNLAVTGTPVNAKLNWGSGISGMRGVTYKVDRWL